MEKKDWLFSKEAILLTFTPSLQFQRYKLTTFILQKASFIAAAMSLFVFLNNVLIMQRSISSNPVNKMP